MTTPFVSTRRLSLTFYGALLSGVGLLCSGTPLQASVQTTGDVYPTDDPLTDRLRDVNTGAVTGNEGIEEFSLFFGSIFSPPGTPPQHTFEEGDENKVNIEVGKTSYGSIIINGGSIVRYGHLILGGSKANVNSEPGSVTGGEAGGAGWVRIEGFGTVYNNDTSLKLAGLPEDFEDPTPRNTGEGFDVYVGLTGSGVLQVNNGGRMEIEDALFVGMNAGVYGEVIVDGVGSHISQAGNSGGEEGGLMLIGPAGTGLLTIRNGGQVDARQGAGLGSGSANEGVTIENPGGPGIPTEIAVGVFGGHGTANIEGLGSVWRVVSGLSVGTYRSNLSTYDEYNDGQGDLTISDSGRVIVTENSDGEEADVVVGEFGRVNLAKGRLTMAGNMTTDGTLAGNGRIDTAKFNNRRLGEVQVAQGESMLITSNSTETSEIPFLTNTGLVEVTGGRIEFQRLALTPDDVFRNLIEPAVDDLPEVRGTLHGQNATFRFRSGLSNEADLALTAGNNIIDGNVVNELTGRILLSGGSNTVFEDDLTNNGTLELAPDGTVVSLTVLGDFIGATSGSLNMSLGAGITGAELSHIAVAGDITLGGELHVGLSNIGSNPLDPQPGDQYEIISGAGDLTGIFDLLDLPALSNPLWSWFVDTSDSDVTLRVLDIMPIGADFNADGIVDTLDLNIWEANFGIAMGAAHVQGDADLNGAVNANDYFIWLDQAGGPGMVAAALGFGNQAGAPVPEPSSLLLMVGGVVALGIARRRCSQR